MKRAAGILVLGLGLAACGDGTGPDAHAGLYRLVSVNGQPLPYAAPPSMGLFYSVSSGDLLLRGDGTYGLGIQTNGSSFGGLAQGRWQVRGASITFQGDANGVGGTVYGDSVVLELPMPSAGLNNPGWVHTYVFRRAALPAAGTVTGRYVMTTVDGRADRTLTWRQGAGEFETRVAYDTLEFVDPVFFRRSRAVESEARWPDSEPLRSSESFVTWGAWSAQGEVVVLRDYGPGNSAQRASDTLRVAQTTLVRRVPVMSAEGIRYIEEVYQR